MSESAKWQLDLEHAEIIAKGITTSQKHSLAAVAQNIDSGRVAGTTVVVLYMLLGSQLSTEYPEFAARCTVALGQLPQSLATFCFEEAANIKGATEGRRRLDGSDQDSRSIKIWESHGEHLRALYGALEPVES